MPAFLRKNSYQDVTDGKATVFQPAYHTELDTYTYFSQKPENLTALIRYMGLEQDVRGRWLKEYPFERQTQDWNPSSEEALFVDIGGNVGHYCALFKGQFPNVPGRIILEDLPDTLNHALPTAGVEKVGHDFFQPQPIKGAYRIPEMLLLGKFVRWNRLDLHANGDSRCQILSFGLGPA